MKEIRNYKNIRRKPQIKGFSPEMFFTFIGIGLLTAFFIFIGGFDKMRFGIWAVINFISLILTKIVFSSDSFMRKILDEKFPKEISALTKTKKKK